MAEWNRRLKEARMEAGLSVEQACFRAWVLLPAPSQRGIKTIERYERDASEDTAEPMFIAALAQVYGVPITDISPLIAERVRQLGTLADFTRDSRCYPNSAGQEPFATAA